MAHLGSGSVRPTLNAINHAVRGNNEEDDLYQYANCPDGFTQCCFDDFELKVGKLYDIFNRESGQTTRVGHYQGDFNGDMKFQSGNKETLIEYDEKFCFKEFEGSVAPAAGGRRRKGRRSHTVKKRKSRRRRGTVKK